ncbi:MAG: hypothetical protein IJ808_02910 [Muribaculaceae bacterium]|nr:hypothetical protein [Muribaculaceae bacterium]
MEKHNSTQQPGDPLATLTQEQRECVDLLVAQADADGYLRGRNEKIEASQPFQPPDDDTFLIPQYPTVRVKRSVWD